MGKLLFIPFSIAGSLLAGFVGKKLFERVWALIDTEEPPQARHRDISVWKMVAALAIEGAIFRGLRGAFDHYSRRSYARFTGAWPGEEQPEVE